MKKPGKAALARARALYDEGRAPLKEIARQLRLSDAAFRALRQRDAWPPRRAAAPVPAPPETAPEEPFDAQALERRLARALRREIARAESEIENASHPGAERKARILGLLVKTLADLRRLDADKTKGSDETDDPPRDLAALRQALVDRLEALRGKRSG